MTADRTTRRITLIASPAIALAVALASLPLAAQGNSQANSPFARQISSGSLGVGSADSVAVAQPRRAAPGVEGFKEGTFYMGPRVIAGGYGATAIGFQVEKGIMQKKDWGNGRIGVSGSVDMFSYSDAFVGSRWSYRVIPVSGMVNYHFTLENKKLDPFIGAGLGYWLVSSSYDGPGSAGYTARASTVEFGAQLGARYFFKPNLAVQAQTGMGFGAFALGLTWKL